MPVKNISSIAELEELYGQAHPLSLAKETNFLTNAYQEWLSKSRFFALATTGVDGLDCTPRGDQAEQAFKVVDRKTIIIPDRRGNNRLDSLKNIILNPNIALMFLIPGINEALRINGRATLTTDPDLISQFDMNGKMPKSIIHVDIEAVYFQCARALIRSELWNSDKQFVKNDVPSAGQMMQSVKSDFDGDEYERILPERQQDTLY